MLKLAPKESMPPYLQTCEGMRYHLPTTFVGLVMSPGTPDLIKALKSKEIFLAGGRKERQRDLRCEHVPLYG